MILKETLPGGPIIRTSHLKISLSSTSPAENPLKEFVNTKNKTCSLVTFQVEKSKAKLEMKNFGNSNAWNQTHLSQDSSLVPLIAFLIAVLRSP